MDYSKLRLIKLNVPYSYPALCRLIDEPVNTGKSKQCQLKRWEFNLSFERNNSKIVVLEVLKDCAPPPKKAEKNPLSLQVLQEKRGQKVSQNQQELQKISPSAADLNPKKHHFLTFKKLGNKMQLLVKLLSLSCFSQVLEGLKSSDLTPSFIANFFDLNEDNNFSSFDFNNVLTIKGTKKNICELFRQKQNFAYIDTLRKEKRTLFLCPIEQQFVLKKEIKLMHFSLYLQASAVNSLFKDLLKLNEKHHFFDVSTDFYVWTERERKYFPQPYKDQYNSVSAAVEHSFSFGKTAPLLPFQEGLRTASLRRKWVSFYFPNLFLGTEFQFRPAMKIWSPVYEAIFYILSDYYNQTKHLSESNQKTQAQTQIQAQIQAQNPSITPSFKTYLQNTFVSLTQELSLAIRNQAFLHLKKLVEQYKKQNGTPAFFHKNQNFPFDFYSLQTIDSLEADLNKVYNAVFPVPQLTPLDASYSLPVLSVNDLSLGDLELIKTFLPEQEKEFDKEFLASQLKKEQSQRKQLKWFVESPSFLKFVSSLITKSNLKIKVLLSQAELDKEKENRKEVRNPVLDKDIKLYQGTGLKGIIKNN